MASLSYLRNRHIELQFRNNLTVLLCNFDKLADVLHASYWLQDLAANKNNVSSRDKVTALLCIWLNKVRDLMVTVSIILVGRQCQEIGQLVTINLHDRAINQALVAASTLLRYLKQLFCRSEGKIDLSIAVEKAGFFPCFALVRWAEK